MPMLERFPELAALTADEKLALASELWAEVEGPAGQCPELAAELDRRMAEYERDPSQVTTWEECRDRILARRRNNAA